MNVLDYFVKDGVYKLNNGSNEFIFVCMPSTGTTIGKLVQYKLNDTMYEKTGVSYFLNSYNENDIKSIFLKRENYEMLGMIGQNFVMSDNEEFVLGS